MSRTDKPDRYARSNEMFKRAEKVIPLGSQTVLLKGVNDNVETMTELMLRLLVMRVRPYYLYQCDPISGSAHFQGRSRSTNAFARTALKTPRSSSISHFAI